jgi:hypothetical protein
MSDTTKCKCGERHDGWPGKDGGELCQMCWEADCSESWWEMARTLPGSVFPVEEGRDDNREMSK